MHWLIWVQIGLEIMKLLKSKPKDEGLSEVELHRAINAAEEVAGDMDEVRKSVPIIKGLLEDAGGLLK